MITGKEGGFVHRIMPPVDWDCGPIPEECNNPELIASEIEALLLPVYLDEARVRKLADSDDPLEILRAKMALELLAEIDARTISFHNYDKRALDGKDRNEGL